MRHVATPNAFIVIVVVVAVVVKYAENRKLSLYELAANYRRVRSERVAFA